MAAPLLRVVALCIGFGGCIPIVTHPPEVKRGTSGGMMLGLGTSASALRDQSDTDVLVGPALQALARYGWASADSTRAAFLIGVQASPSLLLGAALNIQDAESRELLQLSDIDLYMQLPGREHARLQRGVGVLLSTAHVMPYVQFGRTGANEMGWYTTQGIAYFPEADALLWMPSIARREGKGHRAVNFQLTAGLGRRQTTTFRGSRNEFYGLLIGSVVLDFFANQAR